MKYFFLQLLTLFLSFSSFSSVAPVSGDSTLCAGSFTTLIDSSIGGSWNSSDTLVAKVDTSGNVWGISGGTATITYSLGSIYQTKIIVVKPKPSPIMTTSYLPVSTYYICVPACCLTFIDTTSGGGSWAVDSLSGFTYASMTITTVIIDMSYTSGFGFVYFTDTAGCSTQLSIVDVGPPEFYPKIVGDTIVYVDSTTKLLNPIDPHNTNGGIWSSSDTTIATIGSTTGVVTGISQGVTTIDFLLGCYTSITLTVISPEATPIVNGTKENGITIYPNPIITTLAIASPYLIKTVSISNLLGQTIFEYQNNSDKVQIDVSNLPPGVYLIRINNTEVRKFVKE